MKVWRATLAMLLLLTAGGAVDVVLSRQEASLTQAWFHLGVHAAGVAALVILGLVGRYANRRNGLSLQQFPRPRHPTVLAYWDRAAWPFLIIWSGIQLIVTYGRLVTREEFNPVVLFGLIAFDVGILSAPFCSARIVVTFSAFWYVEQLVGVVVRIPWSQIRRFEPNYWMQETPGGVGAWFRGGEGIDCIYTREFPPELASAVRAMVIVAEHQRAPWWRPPGWP